MIFLVLRGSLVLGSRNTYLNTFLNNVNESIPNTDQHKNSKLDGVCCTLRLQANRIITCRCLVSFINTDVLDTITKFYAAALMLYCLSHHTCE